MHSSQFVSGCFTLFAALFWQIGRGAKTACDLRHLTVHTGEKWRAARAGDAPRRARAARPHIDDLAAASAADQAAGRT